MKTYLQKRIADIKSVRCSKHVEDRYIAQVKRQGWSDMDLWGLNTYLAKHMLPMLQKFFKNPNGYPYNIKSIDEWKAIGAEIVWAVERYAKDDFFELAEKSTGYHAIKTRNNRKLRNKWLAETKKLYRRADKGMHLFAKYFGNLWD